MYIRMPYLDVDSGRIVDPTRSRTFEVASKRQQRTNGNACCSDLLVSANRSCVPILHDVFSELSRRLTLYVCAAWGAGAVRSRLLECECEGARSARNVSVCVRGGARNVNANVNSRVIANVTVFFFVFFSSSSFFSFCTSSLSISFCVRPSWASFSSIFSWLSFLWCSWYCSWNCCNWDFYFFLSLMVGVGVFDISSIVYRRATSSSIYRRIDSNVCKKILPLGWQCLLKFLHPGWQYLKTKLTRVNI